ncbi:MAG: metallophosphoesterase [Planctomycetes bacterium]|nr:metallophosphoesterase [Planctomycetota bacterium]
MSKFRVILIFSFSVLFLAIALCNSHEPKENNSKFFFVQITDTHFGDGDGIKRTRKVIEMINALPMQIECVVHTGDITMDKLDDKNIVESGLSVMNKLSVPVHYVPGNHDIVRNKLKSTSEVFSKKFGGLISTAEYDGVVFVFLYTEPLSESFSVDGYAPLEQLEAELKKAAGKPVVIFHHAPSVDEFFNGKFIAGWKEDIREKWIKLVNQYDVKAVFAGHFHADEQHWLGEVPLYVSSSVAGYWGRQASFRIYEYDNGKVSYRTQYVGNAE